MCDVECGMSDVKRGDGSAEPGGFRSRGSLIGWVVAYVFFPWGPFVYMAWLRAMSWRSAAFFAMVSACTHWAMIWTLSKTNSVSWQPWLGLVLGASFYIFGLFQFIAGQRVQFWNGAAMTCWRIAGWFFGIALLWMLGMLIAMVRMLAGAGLLK